LQAVFDVVRRNGRKIACKQACVSTIWNRPR
jgi:hypothetical protein